MKVRLHLSAADQTRLGCADSIDLDPLTVTVREAMALAVPFWPDDAGKLHGFDTPRDWRRALRGIPIVDDNGDPVLSDVQELDDDGEPLKDGDGQPVMRPTYRPHWGAEIALIWLGLRRAGLTVSLTDLEYDPERLVWEQVEDDDSGKAETAPLTPES